MAMKTTRHAVDSQLRELFASELALVSGLDHDNIARFETAFLGDHKLCILMEFCDGGDLRALIRKHLARGLVVPD